jgi:hypothetical protein
VREMTTGAINKTKLSPLQMQHCSVITEQLLQW